MVLSKRKVINFFAGFVFLLCLLGVYKVNAENFTVTGYYSPLPKQEFYLTGDYESEIRLNGKGIAAADGTEVYHGMIAAPANYKFGTKICLNKLGCGVVHDRGGAIVKKGERSLAVHDRLDFWMGYGLAGLQKSLLWGVQNVKGDFVKEKKAIIPLSKDPLLPQFILDTLRQGDTKDLFATNLQLWASGEEVIYLKEALEFMGLFKGKNNNRYDKDLETAVKNFQLKYEVISSDKERGTGRFGPKTREKMTEISEFAINRFFYDKWQESPFSSEINYGDHNLNVYRFQQLLYDEKFLAVGPTGLFGPKTKEALKEFQLAYGLIKRKNQVGAGNFGPKTREKMTELWLAKRDKFFPIQEAEPVKSMELVENIVSKELRADLSANTKLVFLGREEMLKVKKENVRQQSLFGEDIILFRGKRSEDVRKLQKFLQKEGFFSGNLTGYFGDQTAEALLSFQIKNGIVENRRSVGASIFGPSTRKRVNEMM